MRLRSRIVVSCSLFLVAAVLPGSWSLAQEKPSSKSVCSQPKPQQSCTADNTCGSSSNPCTVDIKRTATSAEVTADTRESKGNAVFCVKTGTSVTWRSPSKNIGFLVDVSPSFPFAPGEAIIGGSDRPVSVVATKPGCYKYSAGACASGAIYGMCKTVEGEFIVTE